jgi:hypothetical protein
MKKTFALLFCLCLTVSLSLGAPDGVPHVCDYHAVIDGVKFQCRIVPQNYDNPVESGATSIENGDVPCGPPIVKVINGNTDTLLCPGLAVPPSE